MPRNPDVTMSDVWRETKGWARDAAADALEALAAKVAALANIDPSTGKRRGKGAP